MTTFFNPSPNRAWGEDQGRKEDVFYRACVKTVNAFSPIRFYVFLIATF